MERKSNKNHKSSVSKKKTKMMNKKRQREGDIQKDDNNIQTEIKSRKNSIAVPASNSTELKEDKISLELSQIRKITRHWERIQMEDIKEILTRNKEFIFGNYDRYYYKRFLEVLKEPRLGVFQTDWFKDKKCLDIGCNDGTVTIMIAVCYQPKHIEGIDIDYRLIKSAIKNMKYVTRNNLSKNMFESIIDGQNSIKIYKEFSEVPQNTSNLNSFENLKRENSNEKIFNSTHDIDNKNPNTEKFLNESAKMKEILDKLNNMPKSFLINLGYPVNSMSLNKNEKLISIKNEENLNFPRNITFSIENYVADIKEEEKYDTILCLSTSKWIHLNYGDVGIKTLFYNVYKQLKPEGIFIFEPQGWKSYKKRKNLTPMINKNFSEITLKPDQFKSYLEKIYNFECILITNPPSNAKKSYERPIFIFKKTK